MNFDSLFTPFHYKGLTLKNRFVMAPMTRAFAVDGIPNQQLPIIIPAGLLPE
jgi:2,4-dienoyl-CoA reductase-like NADH-dependent reductase (Old Yellow Enzyme family)